MRRQWWRWRPLVAAGLAHDRRAAGDLAAADWRVELWEAFRRLPVELRTVAALRYVLDLSESDTAEVLRVPPGTVKSRLHRARQLLQKELGGGAEEGCVPWPSPTK